MTVSLADLLDHDPRKIADELAPIARGANRDDWLEELGRALDRHRAHDGLARVLAVWRLSMSEAADLFGVSRQAVSKWQKRGVPNARLEAVVELAAATDLLVRYLKRDRIPAVVRRRAARLDGLSLLDLVRDGRTRDVLDACRAMFEFGNVHV